MYAIEYYKNKERKIGPITVEVAPGRINPDYKNIEMDLYHDMTLLEAVKIQNMNLLAEYSCSVADSSIVSVNKCKEILDFDTVSVSYILSGKKEGTTTLTVYETFKGKKKNLGTVNITMKDLITEFTFDPDICSSEDGLLKYTFYLDEEETPDDNIYEFIIKEPQYQINGDDYQYKYNIQFTSSDETVIKIADKGEIILGKQGTAILKATCGGFTTELHVTVE